MEEEETTIHLRDFQQPLLSDSTSDENESSTAASRDGRHFDEGPDAGAATFTRDLYISHFLTTMNSRIFEFGATLFLATLYPESLAEVSIYAITRSLCAILLAPALGTYIDRSDRRTTVQASIVLQRVATCLSYILFLLMTTGIDSDAGVHQWKLIAFIVLCGLAGVEKVSSVANLVAVERDWVPVLAGDDRTLLRQLNSQMRRIDLGCKMVGPLVIGWLHAWSIWGALVSMASINFVSTMLEMWTTNNVYKSCPLLAAPRSEREDDRRDSDDSRRWCLQQGRSFYHALRVYFTSTAAKPSFALALLYCTVLSFNGQMIAYLVFAGLGSGAIASLRMASIISELSATWTAPRLIEKIGAVRTGSWSINYELACLVCTTALFFAAHTPSPMGNVLAPAAIYLVSGVVLSRAGLWGFDLSAQIIIQEEVEADRRGTFSATESMFQNVFELVSFASTLVFSRPENFRWPVLISAAAVALAAGLYASFVRQRRGHLLHFTCYPDPAKNRW